MNKNYGTNNCDMVKVSKITESEKKKQIREFAMNNGISLKVARIMLSDDED